MGVSRMTQKDFFAKGSDSDDTVTLIRIEASSANYFHTYSHTVLTTTGP